MPIDAKVLNELAERLSALVPEGARQARDDLERNFRAVLQQGLSRLDLVTREEFDIQQQVLTRTREKLEVLNARLAELESALEADEKKATKGS